mgnify:CR=1 FL=1
MLKFPQLNAPPPPETTYQYDEEFRRDLKSGENMERIVHAGYSLKEKQLSFMKRFGNWVANIGIIGFAWLIAGLIFFPAATMTWLFTRYSKFKKALQQTVNGIETSRSVENHPALKTGLSIAQDIDTKRIVDDMRR